MCMRCLFAKLFAGAPRQRFLEGKQEARSRDANSSAAERTSLQFSKMPLQGGNAAVSQHKRTELYYRNRVRGSGFGISQIRLEMVCSAVSLLELGSLGIAGMQGTT